MNEPPVNTLIMDQSFRTTLDLFKPDGLIEVRTTEPPVMSGYYRDRDKLVGDLMKYKDKTWYFVMNEINEACAGRVQFEKLITERKLQTTSDGDITRIKWILIDSDPVRPSGTSSNEEEKEHAYNTTTNVRAYLRQRGFQEPVMCDSGNGYHLLYSVDLEPADKATVKRFLETLDLLFSDDHVHIDTVVYNPARITKLYGCLAKKGSNNPERPWRFSSVLEAPSQILPTSIDLIQSVLIQQEEPDRQSDRSGRGDTFDIDAFIRDYDIPVRKEVMTDQGRKIILEQCPFDPNHKAPDSALFVMRNGALGFRCLHDSCRDKRWRDVRLLFDPKAYERKSKPTGKAAGKSAKTADVSPALVCVSDIPYEAPRFLFAPYIQMGKGCLIQGDNGQGKTALVCGIAALVSSGKPLVDIPCKEPGDVIILSQEDDLPVLRGRIEASGGNTDRCFFVSNAAGLSFNSPEIEELIQEINAKLIIFDPLQEFIGADVDMYRPNETRPALSKLFEVTARNNCACIIISHMGKNRDGKASVNRSLGSVDIPAVMRSILELTTDPDNPKGRIAIHTKCSNAPKGDAICYEIGDRGGVRFTGFSLMTEDDFKINQKRKESGIEYEQEPLVDVIKSLAEKYPEQSFFSYQKFREEGKELLGQEPDVTELKRKLKDGLARELEMREKLVVKYGHVAHGNIRGLTISRIKY